VKADIYELLDGLNNKTMDREFVRLASQCASTFRATDYRGGCNGGRIRFPPGINWPINAGLDTYIDMLKPIKDKYGVLFSYADLIVLAGNVGAERLGAPTLPFCRGRTDAIDGSGWIGISYNIEDHPTSVDQVMELINRRGQSYEDAVALTFPLFQSAESLLFFLQSGTSEFDDFFLKTVQYVNELRHWAERFASGTTAAYGNAFARAWTRLMNADRFNGPIGNLCELE
jgi:Peroxidase